MEDTSTISSDVQLARERMIQFLQGSKTHEDLIKQYSLRVDTYDKDMVAVGFTGYAECGRKLAELTADKGASILDLGCGTGGLGEKLKSLGYENVCGIDANGDFVKKSLEKGVYCRVDRVDVGRNSRMPFDDETFDFVVAVAVFVPKLIDHTAFSEINRVLKKGGHLLAFMRRPLLEIEREDFNIKAAFEQYVADGMWDRLPDLNTTYHQEGTTDDSTLERNGVLVTVKKL